MPELDVRPHQWVPPPIPIGYASLPPVNKYDLERHTSDVTQYQANSRHSRHHHLHPRLHLRANIHAFIFLKRLLSHNPAMPTVGIFPASGALASSTYNHLIKQIPRDNIILISRYPENLPQDVRTRKAAYEDSQTELEAVFAGIDVLFLVSYPSHVHEYRTEVQLPAINAAHKAGVKHIFYSSLAFALPDKHHSKAEVMGAHLDSEEQLGVLSTVDQNFSWTSIREGLYHESFPIYTAFFDVEKPVEEICIPHDGSSPGVSWAKRDELGEATANLIAQYARNPAAFAHKNKIVTLTGPTEWSLAETVKTLSEIIGKPVKIKEVPVDEFVKQPQVESYFGFEEKARTWATAWEAIRDGETAYVSPTLEELLGRKPEAFDVTMRKWVAEQTGKTTK